MPDNLITHKERVAITRSICNQDNLRGIDRTRKLGFCIGTIAGVLASHGFTLDMVSGDILLGEQGSRLLNFYRKTNPNDPFHPGVLIENSCVSFNWENVAGRGEYPRWEVIAYLS